MVWRSFSAGPPSAILLPCCPSPRNPSATMKAMVSKRGVPAVDRHVLAGLVKLDAVAVELDLVRPGLADRHGRGPDGAAGRDEGEAGHARGVAKTKAARYRLRGAARGHPSGRREPAASQHSARVARDNRWAQGSAAIYIKRIGAVRRRPPLTADEGRRPSCPTGEIGPAHVQPMPK